MTITFQETPLGRNEQWLTAEAHGRHRLKAYVDREDDLLTVYWSAAVRRSALGHIIEEAKVVLTRPGELAQHTLTGYGETTAEYKGSTPTVLVALAFPEFDAYRADVQSSAGSITVWANVEDPSLPGQSENIGVCATKRLFDGIARPVFTRAVRETLDIDSETISGLLDEISKAVSGGNVGAAN